MSTRLKLHRVKILVTGGAGFLGSHVVGELQRRGVTRKQLFIPRSAEYDLTERKNCVLVTKNIDIVIHLAANSGGIGKNLKYPGSLFYDNAVMGIELMEAARKNGVKKFITIGTVCAYPKFTPVPFKESYLWYGYPEETNAAYGIAKKLLLVQGQAYRKQYGFHSIHLLLVNLYGPGDNFDPENSHVIPALIRKVDTAISEGKKQIVVWGTGQATREFLYVEDAARVIVLVAEKYDREEPLNIGGNSEISIKELVRLISQLMNFQGRVTWDKRRPDGQPRRKVDVTLAHMWLGFSAATSYEEGLRRTIAWYRQHKSHGS